MKLIPAHRYLARFVYSYGLVVLLCSFLLFVNRPAIAQTVYKYKNEQGKWAYSDEPQPGVNVADPSGDEGRVFHLEERRSSPDVKVMVEDRVDGKHVIVDNQYAGAVQLALFIVETIDGEDLAEITKVFVVPGSSRKSLVVMKPPAEKNWSVAINMRDIFGDPAAEVDHSFLYRVPYAISTHHRISQAFNGVYSHTNDGNKYAVDIVMPVGTKIYAARAGVVISVSRDFYSGGVDKKLTRKANMIRVMHNDGSMSVYAHLNWSGIRVWPGDEIEEGQYIADSGNTGFTSGPHLHFVIQYNANLKLATLPFRFRGRSGASVLPKQGLELKAY